MDFMPLIMVKMEVVILSQLKIMKKGKYPSEGFEIKLPQQLKKNQYLYLLSLLNPFVRSLL